MRRSAPSELLAGGRGPHNRYDWRPHAGAGVAAAWKIDHEDTTGTKTH
ncbi:hypothetical protein PLANPX_1337 [Lacipirellula parvula]|uniref:Uncharacterized protein n=1 Tax=Lacipirellula parvula TaxID=2650471 RepID=A0A5K7X5U4_9BACT|nr:hypothetical protein PLANPX_1337 [Lacipirellula parvula]